jgi:hypothetical protein
VTVHVANILRFDKGCVQDDENFTVSSAAAAVSVRAETAPIITVRSIRILP